MAGWNPILEAAAKQSKLATRAGKLPDTSRSVLEDPQSDTKHLGLEMIDLLSNLVPSKAAVSGIGGAAAGIIRRGGATDLIGSHGAELSKLLGRAVEGKPLTHPSIGISTVATPFVPLDDRFGVNLIMNPKSQLFDPELNNLNQLFERDAYVTRSKSPELGKDARDLRLTEGITPNFQQSASILASERFPSFKDYEKSEFGANLLRDSFKGIGHSALENKLYSYLDAIKQDPALRALQTAGLSEGEFSAAVVGRIYRRAQLGDRNAENLLKDLRSIKSNYGELKTIGEVPITQDNFVAAVLSPKAGAEVRAEAREFTARTGIPSGVARDLVGTVDPYFFSERFVPDLLAAERGIAKRDSGGILDLSGTNYLDGYEYKIGMSSDVKGTVLDIIDNSTLFTSDVARILTEQAVK